MNIDSRYFSYKIRNKYFSYQYLRLPPSVPILSSNIIFATLRWVGRKIRNN